MHHDEHCLLQGAVIALNLAVAEDIQYSHTQTCAHICLYCILRLNQSACFQVWTLSSDSSVLQDEDILQESILLKLKTDLNVSSVLLARLLFNVYENSQLNPALLLFHNVHAILPLFLSLSFSGLNFVFWENCIDCFLFSSLIIGSWSPSVQSEA